MIVLSKESKMEQSYCKLIRISFQLFIGALLQLPRLRPTAKMYANNTPNDNTSSTCIYDIRFSCCTVIRNNFQLILRDPFTVF